MFTIYGFDPRTLTNNELFEKQVELTRRRFIATRFGKPDMADQLQVIIQAIEFERRERMFNDIIGVNLLNSPAVVVETDPDLKAKDEQIEEESENPKPPQQTPMRPVRKPIRSDRPVQHKPDGAV
jgi:hypothetical protein